MIECLLIFLGGSILIASVLSYWVAHKTYASTWTITEVRSQSVAGGPYREGQSTVTALVPRKAPVIAHMAAFSGHALSLYLAVFLPFFLPIVLDDSSTVILSIIVIAAGVATQRSARAILDGSAPPGATPAVVSIALLMTGGIAFLQRGSLRVSLPLQPGLGLYHVVLPIWAAVQAALILASASVARRIVQPVDDLARREEPSKLSRFLGSGWD